VQVTHIHSHIADVASSSFLLSELHAYYSSGSFTHTLLLSIL